MGFNHLKNKPQHKEIITQCQQNVNKKLQLQIQNDVPLKNDLTLNVTNKQLKKSYQ